MIRRFALYYLGGLLFLAAIVALGGALVWAPLVFGPWGALVTLLLLGALGAGFAAWADRDLGA